MLLIAVAAVLLAGVGSCSCSVQVAACWLVAGLLSEWLACVLLLRLVIINRCVPVEVPVEVTALCSSLSDCPSLSGLPFYVLQASPGMPGLSLIRFDPSLHRCASRVACKSFCSSPYMV